MSKVEKVTAADVDAAKLALEQGRKALEEAREAFFDGRGDWAAVKSQEAVVEFAEASLIKLDRDRRKYDEEVRQAALVKLRREIDEFTLASGDEFTKLLDAFESAAVGFAGAFKVRNDKIKEWSATAKDLGVRSMQGRVFPAADDAGIAVIEGPDSDLRVGDRILSQRWSGRILTSLLHSLATDGELLPYFRDQEGVSPMSFDETHQLVSNLDHEAPAVPSDALFFRNREGALLITGPANGFSPEVMKRDGLREITREQAENA